MKIKKSVVVSGFIFLLFGAVIGASMLNQNTIETPTEEWKATLFILPEKGTFIVDEDFQVTVNVDTNMEINAASSELHFSVNELEVLELSKKESIFSLWAVEPSFSNTNGTIQFSGGLPTPGFKGNEGEILTITFRAKQASIAGIKFGPSLVLANDGKATNILKETKGASFSLITPTAPDLNDDGFVNIIDLSILLSNWGISKNPKADINKDNKVDISDFSILLFNLVQTIL